MKKNKTLRKNIIRRTGPLVAGFLIALLCLGWMGFSERKGPGKNMQRQELQKRQAIKENGDLAGKDLILRSVFHFTGS